MKYLNGECYVKVKDHRYRIHSTENIMLRKSDAPQFLRTQYQVKNETPIRKNQKAIKNDKNELILKNYPKTNQPIIHKQNYKPPSCLTLRRKKWLDFDKGYNCTEIVKTLSTNRNIRLNKKFIDKIYRDFSTRLP